jgi:hypothetical protein
MSVAGCGGTGSTPSAMAIPTPSPTAGRTDAEFEAVFRDSIDIVFCEHEPKAADSICRELAATTY